MRALVRAVSSFVVVWLTYVSYAAFAVPWIEPPAETRTTPVKNSTTSVPQATGIDRQQAAELSQWFQPGDWELDSPKILETPQGLLLLKSYEILPDKQVRLVPCSLVMLPRGIVDAEQRKRQAIVMRAPQGAVLRFSQQFDLRSTSLGTLQGGQLQGPIEIRSDQRQPGPEDDLLIQTRDVELQQTRVRSPHELRFSLGRSEGRGRGLQIDLKQSSASREGGPAFVGVRLLQVNHDVRLLLVPTPRDPEVIAAESPTAMPAASRNSQKRSFLSGPDGQTSPVEVTCRGPFRFDLEGLIATFEGQVVGHTVAAAGDPPGVAPDELSADLLAVHFDSSSGDSATRKLSGLEPVLLELEGRPAWIRAPSRSAQAQGERLKFNLRTQEAELWGQPEASAVQGSTEIHGPELHLSTSESGDWGRLSAVGPGWLKGTSTADPQQVFEARWTKKIELRPHQGKQLLTVSGQGHLVSPGVGGLDGDEIFLLLVADTQATTTAGASLTQGLAPERLFARGDVRLESPELSARLQKLEIKFEVDEPVAALQLPVPRQPPQVTLLTRHGLERGRCEPARLLLTAFRQVPVQEALPPLPAPPRAMPEGQPAGPALRAPQSNPLPAPRRAPAPRSQRLDLVGAHLVGRVVRAEPESRLAELIVDTDVRLTVTRIDAPQAAGLVLAGDRLRLTQEGPGQVLGEIQGRPATVLAEQMQLAGEEIHLDQAANRVWLDRPGTLRMQVDRDLQGNALPAPDVAELSWQGTMNFDGRTARFARHVTAQQKHHELRTEDMEARLTRTIDFAGAASSNRGPTAAAEIETIICRGGVEFTGRTVDEGGLVSVERMTAIDLALNQQTGALRARGPGWLSQIRRGAAAAPPRPIPAGAPDAPGYNYLRVEYQLGIRGNTQRREMAFTNLVIAVFGPVTGWEATLSPDDVDRLGPRGARLECDELRMAEMPAPGSSHSAMELQALGNTLVEGSAFTARAARLTYAQAKELLVLEGDGRADAQIWWERAPGSPRATNAAQRLMYWTSTGQVKEEGGSLVDLTIAPSTSR